MATLTVKHFVWTTPSLLGLRSNILVDVFFFSVVKMGLHPKMEKL